MTAISIDIRQLARHLGGEVTGRNSIVAPGPGHSRKDRSLSVTLNRDAPDGFLVNSFAGDDPITCRDHVRAAAGLPAFAPRGGGADRPLDRPVPRLVPTPPVPDPEAERAAARKQAHVQELWDKARDPRGTIVETYLASRGLTLTDEVAGDVLRFDPAHPWREKAGEEAISVPAMIAAMRCIHTDRLKAIHRTRLTPDGCKVGRLTYGEAKGAAIKLDADDMVTMGLIIGEGIETVLSARQLGFRPAWALGSATSIGTFPVLSGIEALTILTENDENGTNARAVNDCGTRWHEAGRAVITVASLFGNDINDAIKGRAA